MEPVGTLVGGRKVQQRVQQRKAQVGGWDGR